MGRPKAGLTVAGESMIRRQVRLLREAGASEVLVSGNPERPEGLADRGSVDWVTVWDTIPDAGPLAGLERVLDTAGEALVLVVAVDLPALQVDFLRRLVARAEPGAGVIPEHAGRLEPLAAVYPRQFRSRLLDQLAGGRRAAREWAEAGIREGWMRPWSLGPAEAACLVNWNRPGDWPETAA